MLNKFKFHEEIGHKTWLDEELNDDDDDDDDDDI